MILKDHGLLISEGQTDVQTLVILELLLCLKSIHVSSKMEVIRLVIREVIIRKKKVVNFHNWGGGHPKSLTFSQLFLFFFACSNSSKSAINFFCKGGRGTP